MKWPDCSGLRQIAARESWLPHQEARLLRFRPNVHASEKRNGPFLSPGAVDTSAPRPNQRNEKKNDRRCQRSSHTARSRTSHTRETLTLLPFSLPHSNLSITSPVRPSLPCCWPTIAFSLGFQRRLPPLTCYPTCILHQISIMNFFSVRASLRQHEFTCLAYSSAATSQSLTPWPDVFLTLSLDLNDLTWDFPSTVCHTKET